MTKLKTTEIENHSGFEANLMGLVEPIREGYYVLQNVAVSGNAPKDFIRIYEYGKARKSNPSNWPAYIAKVGHKWYPNESICEQLMKRIGQIMGIRVADSKLMLAKGQLRFLSKYFLNPQKQNLSHGTEIFSAYLEDTGFVETVSERDDVKEIFTFQAVSNAIRDAYSENADKILEDFVKMLFLDSVVGNNDRHFGNWGVIEDITDKDKVCFSPVYDTARGLFWNFPEENIIPYLEHDSKLDSYIRKSYPTTGWDGETNLNHFDLLKLVIKNYSKYCDFILNFDFTSSLSNI